MKSALFNDLIELKTGDLIEIKDEKNRRALEIKFLGGGYEEGDGDYFASNASFRLKSSTKEDPHFFMESVKGNSSLMEFDDFLLVLEYSNGCDECRIRARKKSE